MIDEKALQILFTTYWSSAGWRRERSILPGDLEYAQSKGLMFPPVSLTHDQVVDRALKAVAKTCAQEIADGFLASLTTRRLDLRSALGSYAAVRHLPPHKLSRLDNEPTAQFCAICGGFRGGKSPEDVNVLNFERFKWGGVRHSDPCYAWFDLERFAEASRTCPSKSDAECLMAILEAASSLPRNGKLAELSKAIAPHLKSNDSERRVLISILGYAGILQPRSKPGFFESFVNYSDREATPWSKDDWPYPIQWWRGEDSVNWDAARFWFPQLRLNKRSS